MVAFVGYGVTATAPAHRHAASDFHAIHVISTDTDHFGHHADVPKHGNYETEAGGLSGAGPDETELHAHCAPHFNDVSGLAYLIAAAFSSATRPAEPSTLPASRRAAPPFKPPRLFLLS